MREKHQALKTAFLGIAISSTPIFADSSNLVQNIATCEALQEIAFSGDLGGNYVLTQDIDCTESAKWDEEQGFFPVGNKETPFTGTLEGNGHTIFNLTINRPAQSYLGIFGATDEASITNLTLSEVNTFGLGGKYVAALIGKSSNTTLSAINLMNVSVEGLVDVGTLTGYHNGSESIDKISVQNAFVRGTFAGGLVGYLLNSTIRDAYVDNTTLATAYAVGGLVGAAEFSTITNSGFSGDIVGAHAATPTAIGGLVGITLDVYIDNSVVLNAQIHGEESVGGLVGYGGVSKIRNSHVIDAEIAHHVNVGSGRNMGGLIGTSLHDQLTNTSVQNTNITVWEKGGGLIGSATGTEISQSFADGNVTGTASTYSNIGGLIGEIDATRAVTITDSYSHSSVTAMGGRAGGLVGLLGNGRIERSYAAGRVTGNGSGLGGLVGVSYCHDESPGEEGVQKVFESYWDTQTTGQAASAGGGIPKYHDEMKRQSTFVGWDFPAVWQIDEGVSYPYLAWESTS